MVGWQNIKPTLQNSLSGPWLCLPGNHPVLDLYGLSYTLSHLVLYCSHLVWKYFSAFCGSVPEHHFPTGHRHTLTIFERKLDYHKHYQPDLIASHHKRMFLSLQPSVTSQQDKIGPEKGRRNDRNIGVPIDTPTEFVLGDTVADTQRRREEKKRQRGRRGYSNIVGGNKKTIQAQEGTHEKHLLNRLR